MTLQLKHAQDQIVACHASSNEVFFQMNLHAKPIRQQNDWLMHTVGLKLVAIDSTYTRQFTVGGLQLQSLDAML